MRARQDDRHRAKDLQNFARVNGDGVIKMSLFT